MLNIKARRVGMTHISDPCAKWVEVKVEAGATSIDLGLLSLAERIELRQDLLDAIEGLDIPEGE